jgi:hypothetical protein
MPSRSILRHTQLNCNPVALIAPSLYRGDRPRVMLAAGLNPWSWQQAGNDYRDYRHLSWDELSNIPTDIHERNWKPAFTLSSRERLAWGLHPKASLTEDEADLLEQFWEIPAWDKLQPTNEKYFRSCTMQQYFMQYGFTRERWEDQSWPSELTPADFRGGVRAGHWVIRPVNSAWAKFTCDSSPKSYIRNLWDFIDNLSLSCGQCGTCIGDETNCVCLGCSGVRWHVENDALIPRWIDEKLFMMRDKACRSRMNLAA